MLNLGVRCVRRAVSGSVLTGFVKVAYASLLLVLSCALSPAFAQASAGCEPGGGSGTKTDRYQIKNLCQLQGISKAPTKHFKLVADINAAGTAGWNDNKGFNPISAGAAFSGSFVNAAKYEIRSLTINRSAESERRSVLPFVT